MRVTTTTTDQFFAARPTSISRRDWITSPKNKYRRPRWYDKLIQQIDFWSQEEGYTFCHQEALAESVGVCERSLRTALRFLERTGAITTENDGQNYHWLSREFFKFDLPADLKPAKQIKPDLSTQKQPAPAQKPNTENKEVTKNVAGHVAGHVAAHDLNKDLKPLKEESIIAGKPKGQLSLNKTCKDDRKPHPIINEYQEINQRRFNPGRDKAALAQLVQLPFIAVQLALLHGACYAVYAQKKISSLAYFVPIAKQIAGNKCTEAFLSGDILNHYRRKLARLRAAPPGPPGAT